MEYATVSAARCVSRGHTTIPEFNVTYPSWVARYPSRSRWYNSEEEIMHCRTYNWAAFQRSIAALYERRRVAQQYGCFAEVGLYYELGERWKQHDELLDKFGSEIKC